MAKRKQTTSTPKIEEVADLEAEAIGASGLTLEAGLVFATFLGLLAGVVVAQKALAKYFDMSFIF